MFIFLKIHFYFENLHDRFGRTQNSSQKLLIILDLQNPLKDGKLGQFTLKIAQKKGISLIFSCRSLSYQHISLEKSPLITVLTEAFRYYKHDLTLAQLDSYLRHKLNPSCQNNFPAIALPMIISRYKTRHQPLFPTPQKQLVKTQADNTPSFKIKKTSPHSPQQHPNNTLILPKLPQTSFKPELPLNVPVAKTKINPVVANTSPPSTPKINNQPQKNY